MNNPFLHILGNSIIIIALLLFEEHIQFKQSNAMVTYDKGAGALNRWSLMPSRLGECRRLLAGLSFTANALPRSLSQIGP